MGINVRIQTETGECLSEVSDQGDVVSWLLSLVDKRSTICLRFIDPHGDTVFNTRQLRSYNKNWSQSRPS